MEDFITIFCYFFTNIDSNKMYTSRFENIIIVKISSIYRTAVPIHNDTLQTFMYALMMVLSLVFFIKIDSF